MVKIEESGMIFGNYPDENVFYIEKCPYYAGQLQSRKVKSCEFILKRSDTLYFVEAKTSCPNQITSDSAEDRKEKYNQYISDIILKMRHSLTLYANILLKRCTNAQVPEQLLNPDLSEIKIKLVLVVKNAESIWLVPLAEKLNSEFFGELRIWNIQKILVINEETARKKHLVS